MAVFHLRPVVRAFASQLAFEVGLELRKALDTATIAKVNNRPVATTPGMGGGSAFHGTEYLNPQAVNRSPATHSDRRNVERNILEHRPRKPGARRSSSDLIDAPGAVGVIDAALAAAPDPLAPSHEEMARRAFKAAAPEWISVGSRTFDKTLETRRLCCAAYAEPGNDRRTGLLKRDNRTGALVSWRSIQCSHGELLA